MIVLDTGIRVSTYCRCAVTFAKSKFSDFSPIHLGGNFLYENEKTGLVFTPSHVKVHSYIYMYVYILMNQSIHIVD